MTQDQNAQTEMFGARPQKRAHIVVVGAGLAGALTSYLLARGGVNVTLIDQKDDGMEPGDDIFVPSYILSFLDRIGVGYISQLESFRSFETLDYFRVKPYRQKSHKLPHLVGLINRDALTNHIIAKAREFEDFTVMRRVKVADVHLSQSRVAGVQIELGAETDILRADYVIGADGAKATLKSSLSAELGRADLSHTIPKAAFWHSRVSGPVVGSLPDQLITEPLKMPILVHYPQGDAVIRDINDERMVIDFIDYLPTYVQFSSLSDKDWFADKLKYMPHDVARWLTSARREFGEISTHFGEYMLAQKWDAPGILFIGAQNFNLPRFSPVNLLVDFMTATQLANNLGPHMIEPPNSVQIDTAAQQVQTETEKTIGPVVKKYHGLIKKRVNEAYDNSSIIAKMMSFLEGPPAPSTLIYTGKDVLRPIFAQAPLFGDGLDK